MARESRVKKNRKQVVQQQDVFEYGQKIRPAARPVSVNTSVTPKNTSGGGAAALLQGLGLAGKAVQAYEGMTKERDARHTDEGKLAAARGDVLNDDATEAFIAGYEEITGAGEGYLELQQILNQHSNENAEATLAEYAKTQDMAIAEFFAGRTDSFTKGALPGAISLQKEHQRMFLNKKNVEFEADKLAKTRAFADSHITQIIKAAPADMSKAIRKDLTNTQYLAAKDGMNMSKPQISAQYVGLMGKRAVDAADPSLLNLTAEPDIYGHRLIDNPIVADTVRKFVDKAEAEQDSIATERVKKQEKAMKDVTADITSDLADYYAMAGDPTKNAQDRKAARQSMEKLLDAVSDESSNPYKIALPAEDIRRYRREIQTLTGQNDSLFASVSSPEVAADAKQAALMYPEQLTTEIMDNLKPFLSKDDYIAVLTQKASSLKTAKGQAHRKSPQEKIVEQSYATNKAVWSKKDALGHPMYAFGPERVRYATPIWNSMVNEIRNEKKRYPNAAELATIEQDVEKLLNAHDKYGVDPTTGMPRLVTNPGPVASPTGKKPSGGVNDPANPINEKFKKAKDKKAARNTELSKTSSTPTNQPRGVVKQ